MIQAAAEFGYGQHALIVRTPIWRIIPPSAVYTAGLSNPREIFSTYPFHECLRPLSPVSLELKRALVAPTPTNTISDAHGIILLELGKVRVRIEGQDHACTLAQVLDRILIGLSASIKIWLAAGIIDTQNRCSKLLNIFSMQNPASARHPLRV